MVELRFNKEYSIPGTCLPRPKYHLRLNDRCSALSTFIGRTRQLYMAFIFDSVEKLFLLQIYY